jgi:hypothetical protein
MEPIRLRGLVEFEQLTRHNSCTIDDLQRPIIEPSRIVGDVILLEQIESNVVVDMVLVV